MALMYDGDVKIAIQTLTKLSSVYRPQSSFYHERISIKQVQVFKCPPDGNCLFSALAVAQIIASDKHLPQYLDRAEAGNRLRHEFLTRAKT